MDMNVSMKRKRKKTATQHEIGNKKETMKSERELEMDQGMT